jgi:hypothetical protein
LLWSARDHVRVQYSKQKVLPARVDEDMSKFHGKYFRVEEEIRQLPDGRIELRVNPTGETYGQGAIRFDLKTGQSEIEWFNKNGTSANR